MLYMARSTTAEGPAADYGTAPIVQEQALQNRWTTLSNPQSWSPASFSAGSSPQQLYRTYEKADRPT